MIRNELIKDSTVEVQPETKAPFCDTVTEYQFGKATYVVRLHFNLEAKRSLKDIVGDMITRDLEQSA